jgi:murein DD-endopeptidase MepM/ murein hydrolase activator NlpD
VALEDKYNLFETEVRDRTLNFFPPVNGMLSNGFNAQEKHFAVDITAAVDSPVKAVANGTVILSEWTAETGYVIILEHGDGLLSIYKHNGKLLKSQGEIVQAGEVIASVGNTGELTTGPHLHFELWSHGNPMNPSDYLDFN